MTCTLKQFSFGWTIDFIQGLNLEIQMSFISSRWQQSGQFEKQSLKIPLKYFKSRLQMARYLPLNLLNSVLILDANKQMQWITVAVWRAQQNIFNSAPQNRVNDLCFFFFYSWRLIPNERCSALETYLWIAQMRPSPLPHQTLSLSPPQPNCRATNMNTQTQRKRGKHKVREGVQKPYQRNSKQVEQHLRHPGPRGSVNRDSAGFHCYCFHLIFTSLTLRHRFKSCPYFQSQSSLSVSRERIVTITMATLLSAKY